MFATFNIQNYGVSKASRPAVLDSLARILSRYDLVAIQELSQMPRGSDTCGPHTESAICDLLYRTNAVSDRSFALAVSPRIGDEQYVLMYDSSVVELQGDATYPDLEGKHSRPPHAFHVIVQGTTLAVGTTHTAPRNAKVEIANFPNVSVWMEDTFGADFNILAGDYNADGSYFNEDTMWEPILANMPTYSKLTGNDLDTTVAKSSNTYDRILASASLEHEAARVFVMDQEMDLTSVLTEGCQHGYVRDDVCNAAETDWAKVAGELSDHYPVEICLNIGDFSGRPTPAPTPPPPGSDFGRAGDCAVVGFRGTNPDDFLMVLLSDMAAHMKLYVTDNGVLDTGALRRNEGVRSYIATDTVPAGTVLNLANFSTREEGNLALSAAGDQVIVFVGGMHDPTYLCALTTAGEWHDTSTSASTSALPTGLEEGVSALAVPVVSKTYYTGSRSGTAAELRAAIQAGPAWSSTPPSSATENFEVLVPTTT